MVDSYIFGRKFGLQWHVTDQCDQRCRHCYIWGDKRQVSQDGNVGNELSMERCFCIINDFLQFCHQLRVDPSINISGGDPLLFRWIWELLEYLNSRNLSFMILGNPFYLDEGICEKLKSLGCRAYQMSLDGLEKTHDNMRSHGSFGATFKALRQLKKAGIRTVIMTTVSCLNYREIPDLVKMITEAGVDTYGFARYCPVLNDFNSQLAPLEYKKFLSKMWQVYKSLSDRGTAFTLKDHLWRLLFYEKGLFKTREEDLVFQGCGCGIRHIALLPDGTVYACRRFKSPIGNVLFQSFRQIFLGQELNRYRKIEKLEECRDCELLNYCRGCHAVSHGLYGDFFRRDPQCWRFRDKDRKGGE